MTKTNKMPEAPVVQWLELKDVYASALNPRTHFNEARLAELVESFRIHGFKPSLSHLLVRPRAAGGYELVSGERRWRAAAMLDMEFVPAAIDELSDAETLELQMIENLQREDFSPLEEAAGYVRMLGMRDEEGRELYSVGSIASRVGRTTAHVLERVALMRLEGSPLAVALAAEEVPVYVASLVAKLPTASMREEVASMVLKNPWGPSPMPRQQLEGLIRDKYTRDLRGSTFSQSDEGLVPELWVEGVRVSGGACVDCPHNSKNEAEFRGKFALCMNPACYREKEAAEYVRWSESVRNEAAGRRAATAEEASGLWDFTGKFLAPSAEFVDLGEMPCAQTLRHDAEGVEAWGKLLKGVKLPVVLARDEAGKVHELVDREAALAAARENGHDCFRAEKVRKEGVDSRVARLASEATKAKAADARLAEDRRRRLLGAEWVAIRGGLGGMKELPEGVWRLLVDSLVRVMTVVGTGVDMAVQHGRAGGVSPSEAEEYLRAECMGLSGSHRLAWLVEGLAWCANAGVSDELEVPKGLAKLAGVDLKGVRSRMNGEFAAEAAAAAEVAEIAAGMQWMKEEMEAEDFAWNGRNVCRNPDVCVLALPKNKLKARAEVRVGRSPRGWHVGYSLDWARGGKSGPVSQVGASYSQRGLAVCAGMKELLAVVPSEFEWNGVRERLNAYLMALQKQG